MNKNTWIPLAGYENIWVGQYIVPNFMSNSVLIRLDDHEFVVVSPGEKLLPSLGEMFPDCLGNESITMHIVMNNAYHHLGVTAWRDAFPNHCLYASNKAISQLLKKNAGWTKNDLIDAFSDKLPLPDGFNLFMPPGHRAGDIWLVKDDVDQSLWITCDSFLNYERLSNQPVARMMQRLLGAAPGIKMSQVVKWFILDDRKDFKRWASDMLIKHPPTTLVPSHGEVDQKPDLARRLDMVINQRL